MLNITEVVMRSQTRVCCSLTAVPVDYTVCGINRFDPRRKLIGMSLYISNLIWLSVWIAAVRLGL